LAFALIISEVFGDSPYFLWNNKYIVDFSQLSSRYSLKEDYIAAQYLKVVSLN
jgi:hypothetical protein